MDDATSVPEQVRCPGPIDRVHRRIIGVLIEKAICTTDNYPLTVNSLVAGCNQKSNRAPLMNLEPHQIDEALFQLQDAGLVTQVFPASGRAERWKHNIKDVWKLDKPQRSVIAELMLRGTQTEGELRSRASRMAPFDSLDALRDVLDGLADRGFVRRLSAEGQKRGVVWTHLMYEAAEMARVEEAFAASAANEADEAPMRQPAATASLAAPSAVSTGVEAKLNEVIAQIADLREQLESLSNSHQSLAEELRDLKTSLGE